MTDPEKSDPEKSDNESYPELVGSSTKIREVCQLIDQVAPSNSNVLIIGESGTGKELVARRLHFKSTRRGGPFVVLNCSAVPETLLESELFGYIKGAFTGALEDKTGLFEEAHDGTIFLDEIGEIPPAMQVKLLRVLQDGEMRPVGAKRATHSNARVVAATNKDLAVLVKRKVFREDLYYRLNVITVALPPLRERMDDLLPLSQCLLEHLAHMAGKEVPTLSADALQSLQAYRWPGNVRELENVLERAMVLVAGNTITAREIPPKILGEVFYLADTHATTEMTQLPYQEAKDVALQAFNRSYVTGLLRQSRGNISLASVKAGMDRSNFKKIVKKCEIDIKDLKKNTGE